MMQDHTRARILAKLLESLESAPSGSRELDTIITFLLGKAPDESAQMIRLLVEEGYAWNVIVDLLDDDLVSYTESLDAALPGENIVLALYSRRRKRWAAVHRARGGGEIVAWAATECLARRMAALKGVFAGDGAELASERTVTPGVAPVRPSATRAGPPGAERPRSAQGPGAPQPAQAHAGGPAKESGSEWKILF